MNGVQMQKSSINLEQQSTLARLLAQENIHVIHGNYRTAWFNPEQRVLALPVWKNRGKSVYDLLTGHEVGHALYTPAQGWHDAVVDIKGAPKAYLNVLEDVRIERKVQDKYPGLRFQFKKAYKQLAEEDFFGLSKVADIQALILIDRINLKSKMGEFVECEFITSVEKDFFARAYLTETFTDVVDLAKEIYAYQKSLMQGMKKSKQLLENAPEVDLEEAPPEQQDSGSADDYEKPDEEEEANPEESEVKETTETTKENVDGSQTKSGDRSDDVEQKELGADGAIDTPVQNTVDDNDEEFLDSVTDKSFRDKENSLTAADELSGTMVYTLNNVKQKDVVIDYKEYYSEWKKHIAELNEFRRELIEGSVIETKEDYRKFKNETELAGAYMAKEFELRKAAYQYSRSSVHKTGLINTNKLHSYKYSEDIFLKSTRLANYKNHGMMMFIDFSGSMQDNIGATIRQVLNLTTFCKMVNIPFEVYAFTTMVKHTTDEDAEHKYTDFFDCEIIPQKFNLLNLMSSRMSRREAADGMNMLWNLSQAWDSKFSNQYINPWNNLHSTPLNTCIQYANQLVKNFKAKHGVEKMTTMFLTDGESDSFQARVTQEGDEHRNDGLGSYRYRKTIIRMNSENMEVGSLNSSKVTELMLKNLKKNTNSTVLGFFISPYRNQAIGKVCAATNYAKKDKYTEQISKQRAIIEDDIFGYDRYFGLCAKYMDVVEDEFGEMVEDGASKNKLKTAFSKMTKQKRVNRIFLNAFVDSIA